MHMSNVINALRVRDVMLAAVDVRFVCVQAARTAHVSHGILTGSHCENAACALVRALSLPSPTRSSTYAVQASVRALFAKILTFSHCENARIVRIR